MKPIRYRAGSAEFEGFLFENHAEGPGTSPLIVLFHEYMGLQPFILKTAEALRDLGATVFTADLYGVTVRPETHDEAYPHYRFLKENPGELRRRSVRSIEQALEFRPGAESPLVVMGFSLGGAAALEALSTLSCISLTILIYAHLWRVKNLRDTANMHTRLLVFHGCRDTIVPYAEIVSFVTSLENTDSDMELVLYAKGGHGFFNPSQPQDSAGGSAYDKSLRNRTWNRIRQALSELDPARF